MDKYVTSSYITNLYLIKTVIDRYIHTYIDIYIDR